MHPEALFITLPPKRIERPHAKPERPDAALPPERLKVATMSEHGLAAVLYRKGSLWFRPDGKMVYYVPASWRFLG